MISHERQVSSGSRRDKALARLAKMGSWANNASDTVKRKSRRQSLTSSFSDSLRRRSLPTGSKQKPSAQDFPTAVRSTITLPEIIRNPVLLESFFDYCKSQHCVENLMFWIVTETFQKVHNPEIAQQLGVTLNSQLVEGQARKIHSQYLKNDADHWVCLDCKDVDYIEYVLAANQDHADSRVEQVAREKVPRPSSIPADAPIPVIDHNLFHDAQTRTRKDLEEDIIPRFVRALVSTKGLLTFNPEAVHVAARLLATSLESDATESLL